ncbi:MAG: glycosyltransferase family 4 protein [Bacteroidota bacterium]
MNTKKQIHFLHTHPVQYIVPLYKKLAAEPDIEVTVLFCSKRGLGDEVDEQFGIKVKWDIPILEGYNYVFLKNHSFRKGHYRGILGYINLGVIKHILKAPRGSLLVIQGWAKITFLLGIIVGRLSGKKMALRVEASMSHENLKGKGKQLLRRFVLSYLLFPWFHKFLYIGKQNKAFYKYFGVPENKLIFTPYCVNNERFIKQKIALGNRVDEPKTGLGIKPNQRVILYSGKYIDVKKPLDLLNAFLKCSDLNAFLVFMGEGELRKEMEAFITHHQLNNVVLTGFINQSKVADYYGIADIFVMCSRTETWGLSTNEAMNFGVPVVLPHTAGCADDLVIEGKNGYIFESGNVDELAAVLRKLIEMPEDELREMGEVSAKHVLEYSNETIVKNIKTIL